MLARRLISSRAAALCAALGLALAGSAARAQTPSPPPPLGNPVYGFPVPGDHVTPATAASAGLSLADRWLGASIYENPAASPPAGVEVTPVFQRTSRQDLSSQNRDFDQTFGYLDLAGLSVSLPAREWGFVLYAWQPVLRLEEQTYTAGPLVAPAAVRQLDTQREMRGGVAISRGFGLFRAGVSGEWVRRDDSYETHEQSGSPLAGDRFLDFSGDSYGVSGGLSYQNNPDEVKGLWVGAALHYTDDLKLTGTVDQQLALGDTTYDFEATRSGEWSGGISGRMTVSPATRVLLSGTVRSGQDWQSFGLETTTGGGWSAGLDWKDEELPWGARFGVGQEWNPGALEEKAGLLSIGFTYVSGSMVMDLGLFHRNLEREGFAHSADNRAVLTVKVGF
jgi:hypothetical protein